MSTTLSQLRSRVRYFLDETSPITWANAELNQYINDAEKWLWAELCKTDDSFGLRESTVALVQAQTDYTYPSDILGRNIRSLYCYTSDSDPWRKVDRASYEDVMREGTGQITYPYKYVCMDGYFKIGPPPDASGYTLRIAYTRAPTEMTDDANTMDSDDENAALIAAQAALIALTRTGGDKAQVEKEWKKLYDAAIGNMGPDDLLTAYPLWKYKEDI